MKYIKKFESNLVSAQNSGMQFGYKDQEIYFYITTGNLTKFKELKESGIDITKYTKYYLGSPLIDAVYFTKDFDNNLEICKEIINAGADINWKNDVGETALIVSAFDPNFDVIKLLLKSGADLNIKSDSNVDFFDILFEPHPTKNNYIFDNIKKEFPEEYNLYLIKKSAELYNI